MLLNRLRWMVGAVEQMDRSHHTSRRVPASSRDGCAFHPQHQSMLSSVWTVILPSTHSHYALCHSDSTIFALQEEIPASPAALWVQRWGSTWAGGKGSSRRGQDRDSKRELNPFPPSCNSRSGRWVSPPTHSRVLGMQGQQGWLGLGSREGFADLTSSKSFSSILISRSSVSSRSSSIPKSQPHS